jgi:hypothetical protein
VMIPRTSATTVAIIAAIRSRMRKSFMDVT